LKFDDVDMMDVSDDDRIGQLNKRGMNLVLIVPYPLFINLVVLKEKKNYFSRKAQHLRISDNKVTLRDPINLYLLIEHVMYDDFRLSLS